MVKAPVDLQDLRRRIYVKVKAEQSGRLEPGFLLEVAGIGNGITDDPTTDIFLGLSIR